MKRFEQIALIPFVIKWLLIALIVGGSVGSASAIFLISLKWAAETRTNHLWIIAFLPLAGLLVGLLYEYFGKSVAKGNNLIIEEHNKPNKVISIIMAPLVLLGTILSHLFGASVGREGTAVQIGASFSDQLSYLFKSKEDRKILLSIGVSAGFAGVFGTPLAGAIFALEVMIIGRMRYECILPVLLTAIVSNYVCVLWGVHHTHYHISSNIDVTWHGSLWIVLSGVFFGLGALLFSKTVKVFSSFFKKINYSPLRPFIGGGIFVLVVLPLILMIPSLELQKYIGLGVPTIVETFGKEQPVYGFLLKLLLTTFCLGAGYKGGEVTPLFFIGAMLGNTLSLFIPLPMSLLVGVGFVALFSGATNTPIACTIMGVELFGSEYMIYFAIACFAAYLFSGHSGIYGSQVIGTPKSNLFHFLKGKKLG